MTRTQKRYHTAKVIPFPARKANRYPHSADPNFRKNQMVDLLLSFATCLGAVTTLVYIMLL